MIHSNPKTEEMKVALWMKEATRADLVRDWQYTETKQLKTKVKIGVSYAPDFKVMPAR